MRIQIKKQDITSILHPGLLLEKRLGLMRMTWTYLGTGSPWARTSSPLSPHTSQPLQKSSCQGWRRWGSTLVWTEDFIKSPDPETPRLARSEASRLQRHMQPHPSLPTSCLLLIGGPSAWAFYGHDMPISVFNFHSPFGGSEIPQRWDPLIEQPSVMEPRNPSNVVVNFSANISQLESELQNSYMQQEISGYTDGSHWSSSCLWSVYKCWIVWSKVILHL